MASKTRNLKNSGGTPNVAAELPLCPLLPVCQVPVLPLEWLPGKTAGLVPGEKLIHRVVVAHGSTPIPDACNGSET